MIVNSDSIIKIPAVFQFLPETSVSGRRTNVSVEVVLKKKRGITDVVLYDYYNNKH